MPQHISMVCGNVQLSFKENKREDVMPTLKLTFMVLTMDKTGHITWPIAFAAPTKAALRLQARTLLRRMIDDLFLQREDARCAATGKTTSKTTATKMVDEEAPEAVTSIREACAARGQQ